MGKTHLALELANPKAKCVQVTGQDYGNLKRLLYDELQEKTKSTDAASSLNSLIFDIQVQLPSGSRSIPLIWLDTPGEIWRNSWQGTNTAEWQKFLDELRKSESILLILPPYRELIRTGTNPEDFMTQQQWVSRFERWVSFFQTDCPKVRHLLICLNKADLFCDVEKEGRQLRYEPHGAILNWQQRDAYVFQRYFRLIEKPIQELNRSLKGGSVRCFITSIKDRHLLELPWIYLGTFLASR